MLKLRPYQVIAKNAVRNLFAEDKKRIILCKPTGAGKTVTFADIASDTVKNGGSVCIVVDRKELLEQAKEKLTLYGLKPSIITAGRRGRLNSDSYIATVQTLIRRMFPEVDLWIIDEAHKQTFDKLFKKPEFKDKYIIGATATPMRTGKMNQLADFYDHIVLTTTIRELIADGFLVPAITYGAKMEIKATGPDGVKKKGGDFDEKELYEKIFNKPKLYEGVVEKYKHFANGTKAICFNINVEHSKKTCAAFVAAGIPAIHVDGNTPKVEREKIIRGFKNGFFLILCNCDLYTTGFDEWTIETVIANRATMSLSLWLQMCGRGSRPTPLEFQEKKGYLQKSHFNLIDMGGNTFRLGFWEQEREFSLNHKEKTKVDAAPVKTCPEDEFDVDGKKGCGALIPTSQMICKVCGYKFPVKITELAQGEFLPMEYAESLPADLVGKAWGTLPLEDLERVRVAKGYKLGWIVKQILLRENLTLEDYAKLRNFHPNWINQIKEHYKLT